MHRILFVPLAVLLLALTATVAAGQNPVAVPPEQIQAYLKGYKEVPAVSTHASGEFRAELYATELYYELTYADIEAPATVAQLRLAQKGVRGGAIAYLCGGGGKPACPEYYGKVEGMLTAADIVGPEAQGIEAGHFRETARAIRAGVVYVEVRSIRFPYGEIRGQLYIPPPPPKP